MGRQPWIIYKLMTIDQAANLSTSAAIPGVLIMAFYFAVVPATFYFFVRVFNANPEGPGSGAEVNY